MIYSYTQISQYLTCPRRYRHRYLDGWKEKDTRAAMLFGRAFERALAAYFLHQDAAAALFQEWKPYQDQKLEYSHGDSWDRMLEQGIQLLDRFCQEDRVRIRQPRHNLHGGDICAGTKTGPTCDFVYTGYRVPMIVISPFTKKNYVSHTVADYTAILKFIETRFNLPSLTQRDAAQMDMTEFLDFVNAPWKTPPIPSSIPTQPTSAPCYMDHLP